MHDTFSGPADAARLLVAARSGDGPLPALPPSCRPATIDQAYAIQDATLRLLGPTGGWKVGAKDALAEPTCAPLPASGVMPAPASLPADRYALRGLEVEIGFILAADLPPRARPYDLDTVLAAVGQLCVAVEIVESRFRDRLQTDSLSLMADLASHGALVYRPVATDWRAFGHWQHPTAGLQLDGEPMQMFSAPHPAGDPRRLLPWLANHAAARDGGLRAGQVLITGSCTPLICAAPDSRVRATLEGLSELELAFASAMPPQGHRPAA